MASMTGQLTPVSQMFQRLNLSWSMCAVTLVQTRNAARKSTRERKLKILRAIKAKKLAKLEAEKRMEFINITNIEKLKKKKTTIEIPEYLEDKEYQRDELPTDDVYFNEPYKWKIYSLEEAVQCHREFCHPTVKNKPNSLLSLYVEFNLQGAKKTKPVNKFTRIVPVPHVFDHKEHRIVAAFCKTPEEMEEAKQAGASAVFGIPEIKEISKGGIPIDDFTVFVAHPSVTTELTTIKGHIRKKYPSHKDGTLSPDLTTMIKTQLHGIQYTVTPYQQFLEYGTSSILIGKVNMEIDKLTENAVAVLEDVYTKKPKRAGSFIRRLRLTCADSEEKFKLDLSEFISEEEDSPKGKMKKDVVAIEEDDEDDDYGVISNN